MNTRKLPLIYVVNNTKSSVSTGEQPVELLNDALIKRYKETLTSVDFDYEVSEDGVLAGGGKNELRAKMAKLVRSFIQVTRLVTKEEAVELNNHANAVKEHRDKIKKEEGQAYLTKYENI